MNSAHQKITAPLFAVAVRLFGSSVRIVQDLEGFAGVYGSSTNQLVRARTEHPSGYHLVAQILDPQITSPHSRQSS